MTIRVYSFRVSRLPSLAFGLALAVIPIVGQEWPTPVVGYPHDWSHSHLIFSAPPTPEDAARVQQDPRYWHQQYNRAFKDASGQVLDPRMPFPRFPRFPSERPQQAGPEPLKVDWSRYMGPAVTGTITAATNVTDAVLTTSAALSPPLVTGQAVVLSGFTGNWTPANGVQRITVISSTTFSIRVDSTLLGSYSSGATVSYVATGGPDNSPAKYSFGLGSPTSAVNCAGGTSPDFVVYNTGVTGSGSQASIVAYDNLYTGICSSTVPQTYWAFNTGGTVVTAPVLSGDGTQVAFMQTPSGSVSGSFTGNTTVSSKNVTVTACPSVPNGTPVYTSNGAIPLLNTIASCSGTTLVLGTAASTTTTGTTFTYTTIPAQLALLKWSATGTATSPDTLTAVSNGSYRTCTAPCMTTISFTNGSGSLLSSPFYDYNRGTFTGTTTAGSASVTVSSCPSSIPGITVSGTVIPAGDTMASCSGTTLTLATGTGVTAGTNVALTYTDDIVYAGDSYGWLHKFTGVFTGTPAEVLAGSPAWPLLLYNGGTPRSLSSPVYDPVSGFIFAANWSSYLAKVNASTGAVTNSLSIGSAHQDISEGPIVDSTAQKVYVFVDGQTNGFAGSVTSGSKNVAVPTGECALLTVGAGISDSSGYIPNGDTVASCSGSGRGKPGRTGGDAGRSLCAARKRPVLRARSCSRGTRLRIGLRSGAARSGLPPHLRAGCPRMGVDPMSAYVARSSAAAARKLGEEMMIMSARESTLFGLNDVGCAIWQAADGVTPLEEIVRRVVCAEFDVAPEEALRDAQDLVREMAAHGLLLVSDEPIGRAASAPREAPWT
jgi:hypothetical protein